MQSVHQGAYIGKYLKFSVVAKRRDSKFSCFDLTNNIRTYMTVATEVLTVKNMWVLLF